MRPASPCERDLLRGRVERRDDVVALAAGLPLQLVEDRAELVRRAGQLVVARTLEPGAAVARVRVADRVGEQRRPSDTCACTCRRRWRTTAREQLAAVGAG